MKVVILAGGGGTRLWPVSRKATPKQTQPFIGGKTLLQATYQRLLRGFARNDIYISTNVQQRATIAQQLPDLLRRNYILEPEKRDTAAAIGLVAVTLAKRSPHEVFTICNADHYIRNVREYVRLTRVADRVVRENPAYTVLIGIRPTYPETGYGYIKINKIFTQVGDDEIFFGQRFIEKPNLETAEQYCRSWDYLWNTAMFSWRVDHLLRLYARYLPRHYASLMRMQRAIGTSSEGQTIRREFKKLKPISIDYGILERTRKLLVIPATFDWADVGHWRAVKDILSRQPSDNVVRGRHVGIDSSNNLIYSYTGRLIATAGVKDMVIVDTEDCVLVCPKKRAQDVKKIVEELEHKKMKRYL